MALHAGAARHWRASTCCAPPAGSSSRATCSTGGCRRRASGVRTRISDDRVWLAYCRRALRRRRPATRRCSTRWCRSWTDRHLRPGEHDTFFQPTRRPRRRPRSSSTARAALDGSLAVGAHGLPLIGTGDWNDGMNRVGDEGQGESVWLGWFLHRALSRSSRRWPRRAASRRAPRPGERTPQRLRTSLERTAGMATGTGAPTFDDGTPLGSAASAECRIDSIAQSWSVISGAADADAGAARHGGAGPAPGPSRRRTGAAVDAAVRPRPCPTRATSRATRRGFARTAASTRTPPPGR